MVNLVCSQQNCRKELTDCQEKFSIAESKLDDVFFSLSLKGYSSLIDFTGKPCFGISVDVVTVSAQR